MKKRIIAILVFCWAGYTSAQQNLVPNPSFEEFINCPITINYQSNDTFNSAMWYQIDGTPDYFNVCGSGWGNIYTAYGGGGGAQEGRAYIGLVCRHTISEIREIVQVKLNDSLKYNHKYDCKIFLSLADSFNYATKNFSFYFSSDSLPYNFSYINKNPQVRYADTNLINNKIGWDEINGSFIANGGEKYLAIGNFDDDQHTNFVYVGGGISQSYWNQAYYYIDNVSVTEDTSYHPNGIEEELIKRIQVNYSNGHLQTEGLLFQNHNTAIELYSLSGSKIVALPLKKGNEKQNVKIDGLANGVYLYALKLNNEVVKRGKILIRD